MTPPTLFDFIEEPCGLCEGSGQRLRRVPGGFVSDRVECFACRGTRERQT